jgi:anthranilate 1,2-dioxygenase large subunit
LIWTAFGFEDDSPQMTEMRLRQANLIGPAGYVSMEDGAAPGFVQRAARAAPELLSVVEMGGSGISSSESKVSEAAVRGMWHAWREQMGI